MRLLTNIIKSDGTTQTQNADGTYTLAAGTYYAEFFDNPADRSVGSVHWQWDVNLVATITIEASDFPSTNVSFPRITATSYASTGWASTGVPAVAPAASAAEAISFFADFGAARQRAKIVVGTQGALLGLEHWKARGAR